MKIIANIEATMAVIALILVKNNLNVIYFSKALLTLEYLAEALATATISVAALSET